MLGTFPLQLTNIWNVTKLLFDDNLPEITDFISRFWRLYLFQFKLYKFGWDAILNIYHLLSWYVSNNLLAIQFAQRSHLYVSQPKVLYYLLVSIKMLHALFAAILILSILQIVPSRLICTGNIYSWIGISN
jgi:hypothetical protein